MMNQITSAIVQTGYALAFGVAVAIAVYLSTERLHPTPPAELRVRIFIFVFFAAMAFAALVGLWPFLFALWPHFRFAFDFKAFLLIIVVVFSISRMCVVAKVVLRHDTAVWIFANELESRRLNQQLWDVAAPVIVVRSSFPLGRSYAGQIASFLAQFRDSRSNKTLLHFLPIETLRAVSDELESWVTDHSDATLVVTCNSDSADPIETGSCGAGKTYWVDIIDCATHAKPEARLTCLTETLRLEIAHSKPFLSIQQVRALSVISRDIASCPSAIHEERQRIPHLSHVSDRIRFEAFQPIAKAYVHFRLSSSDTERLLGLFDCFDAMLKTMAFVFIGTRQRDGQDLFSTVFDKVSTTRKLEKLTMGDWVALVNGGVSTNVRTSEVEAEICEFWARSPGQHPELEIINLAKEIGLAGELAKPSYGGWMRWLTEFRNRTRGHGVVRESISRQIWPLFHETFLEIVGQLPETVFRLSAIAQYNDGQRPVANGWPPTEGTPTSSVDSVYVALSIPDWAPHPKAGSLLFARNGSLLVLDKVRGSTSSYLDYSTGQIVKWSSGQREVAAVAAR